MAKTPKISKAPTDTAATNAAGMSETNAVAVVNDASATPPGFSVPGGTNTVSESGAAAGKASAEPVKPSGDVLTEAMVAEAATRSSPSIPPETEAAASGDHSSNASQGDAAGGAGNPAGPADHLFGGVAIIPGAPEAPVAIGMDLGRGPDVGVISWGDHLTALSDTHPNIYRFLARLLEEEPDTLPTALVVKAKTAGFRRGGIVHSTAGLTFVAGDYTAEQLEAWLGEPELTVETV